MSEIIFDDCGLNIEMVFVEGGTFMRGATPEQGDACEEWEKPAHLVTVRDFYIGKFLATQKLWKRVMGGLPPYIEAAGDDLPITYVTMNDLLFMPHPGFDMDDLWSSWPPGDDFITKLNALTGRKYRVPTESEWEYAARGGNRSGGFKYSGGDNIDDVAWYEGNSGGVLHPVGGKRPNELGIYDMSGNVWEYVLCRDRQYTSDAKVDPDAEFAETRGGALTARTIRGGCYASNANQCRVSYHVSVFPDVAVNYLGFRLALWA